jgi:eukaryotic-like serine/threonine-protein kinase
MGRWDDAVEDFEKAIRLSGNDYINWGNLADAYGWLPGNQANPADADVRSTLETLPEPRPAVVFKMGQTSEIAGQRTKAITFLSGAVRKGYPIREIKSDPELATFRSGPNFCRLVLRNSPKP